MTDYPVIMAQGLIDVSLRALLLAGLVAVVLRLWPARNANFQHRAWAVVLWGMLLLPLLAQMTPALSLLPSSLAWHKSQQVAVPLETGAVETEPLEKLPGGLPRSATTPGRVAAPTRMANAAGLGQPTDDRSLSPEAVERSPDSGQPAGVAGGIDAPGQPQVATAARRFSLSWAGLLLAFYLGGLALLAGRLAIGYATARRLVRQATDIPRPLPCSARVAVSDAVRVPVSVGLLRPMILLPADWQRWNDALLSSVITHEQAHIDRRDHLVQLASELNRCLYWFHPVAWFLRRRLSVLAEQCCDDTVIAALRNRGDYAQHLLEMAGRLSAVRQRVAPLAISMARSSKVESRIVAILDEHRPLARRIGRGGALALLAVVGPIVLLAAGLQGADPQPEPPKAGVADERAKTDAETKTKATSNEATKEETVEKETAAATGMTVRGRVERASDGSPADKAEVRLMTAKPDGKGFDTRTTETDNAGNFEFTDVPTGSHRLLALLDDMASRGMRYQATKITVDADQSPEPVVLKLSPAPSIKVHVAKADGAPVADALVRMTWTDTERDHRTDSEGNVVLHGLTPEMWTVEVQAAGFAEQVIAQKLFGDRRTEMNFALQPGGVLHGVVKDSSGRLLEMMGVSIRTAGNRGQQIEYVKTDAEGRYRFGFLPLDEELELNVSSPKYASLPKRTLIPSEGSRDVELDITLVGRPEGGSVQGVVTDEAGKPIAGAKLINQGGSSSLVHETTSDAQGRFTIDDLYESTFGYEVVVRAKGFAPQAVTVVPGPADDPAQVAVKLEPGHQIRGRVVNASGQPIAGVRVSYAHGDRFHAPNIGGQETSDAQGNFAIDSLPAACPFDFTADGYSPVNDRTLPLDGKDDVVVTLQSQGIVRGRAIDAQTGKPIPEFTVRITFSPDQQAGDARGGLAGPAVFDGERFEDADGNFLLNDLRVGQPLQVTVLADHFGPTTIRRIVIQTEAEAKPIEFKLTPIDPATLGTVGGTIVNSEGQPVAGAQLRLIASNQRPAGRDQFPFNWEMLQNGQVGQVDGVVQFLSATSNQRGEFSFQQVRIDKDLELAYWGEGVSEGRLENPEKLPATEREHLRIVAVAPGAIVGKINLATLPQVTGVAATRRGGRSYYEYFNGGGGRTEFQLRNLPPGDYDFAVYGDRVRVAADSEGFSYKTIQRQAVKVETGKTTTLDLGFEPNPAAPAPAAKPTGVKRPATDKPTTAAAEAPDSLTGRVVDDAGNPIGEALVSLSLAWSPGPANQRLSTQTRSDAGGRFVLKLPANWLLPTNSTPSTSVWAYAPGHSLGAQSALKQLRQGDTSELEIVLGPESDAVFHVVDPQGAAQAGVSVEPWHMLSAFEIVPEDIRAAVRGQTDAEGMVQLPALNRHELMSVQADSPQFGKQRARLDAGAEAPAMRTVRLRATGKVELRVTADKPEHVTGLRVSVNTQIDQATQSEQPDEAFKTQGEASGATDDQGRFVAAHLAVGEARFLLSLDPALPMRFKLPEKVQIVEGQTARIDITLEPAVHLRGLVRTKDDGKPLPGVLIGIYYGEGRTARQWNHVRSDADGKFETYVLPGPVWQQVIGPPAQMQPAESAGKKQEITATTEVVDLPPIEMLKTKEIAGRLIDQFGNPLVGVKLFGVVRNRRLGSSTTTENGGFTMQVPPDAELAYRVWPEGQGPVDADIVERDPLVIRARVVKTASETK
jgi:BlaR1 peptidase M56/Carboxypeptidase regulatory-like domain